jgi:polysaccharide biosynthesis transport protein
LEEEIDLRPYIEALLKRRYWIIVFVIIVGITTFLVSISLPPTYEATALMVVTSPQQVVLNSLTQSTFDPNFTSINGAMLSLQAYPDLALSDEMLQQLLAKLELPGDETIDMENLRKLLTAEAGGDRGLIQLTAKYGDAQTAADIANAWADLFVPWVNETYGIANAERLNFFEAQLATARTNLETAEEALIIYQGTNRAAVLQSRLEALSRTLADLLAEQRVLVFLRRDAEQLQTQLTTQTGSAEAPLAYQLTALSLQLRTYDAQTPTNVELQMAAETPLTGADRGEQLNFLAGLISSLTAQQTQNEEMVAEIEPRILVLQQERQAVFTEQLQLQRAQQEAEETYTALVRRVDVERISAEDTTGGVSLASRSAVPQNPVRPRILLNVAVAMLTGMVLAFSVVVLQEWLRVA